MNKLLANLLVSSVLALIAAILPTNIAIGFAVQIIAFNLYELRDMQK